MNMHDALQTWAEQPVSWPVLEPQDSTDYTRWVDANDTPELRVQLAARLESVLMAWNCRDVAHGAGRVPLPRTTIAKLVDGLEDFEAVGLAGAHGLVDSFDQWLQDNPTPCDRLLCSERCAQECAARG